MNQFLKIESDIKSWLGRMNIKPYTLIADETYGFVVDVDNHVDISHQNLKVIPVKFNMVKGDFFCHSNQLTNLLGAPKSVGGDFYCDDNQIASLDGICEKIGNSLSCKENLLSNLKFCPTYLGNSLICDQNRLTSLFGAPAQIHGNFSCSNNLLNNLNYCPQTAEIFWCDNNQLTDLLYCPEQVYKQFYCHNNPGLGDAQKTTDFSKIFQIHLETKRIRDEKENLSNAIEPNSTHIRAAHKI